MSDEVEFWQGRYLAGETPWDFGGVPVALRSWLAKRDVPGRALIPGCGSGYELKAFHDAGWDVTGIDYTPAAVARARRNIGGTRDNIVVLGDFFTYEFCQHSFDVIYERTFLCAMPPERWPHYVSRVRQLLVERGELVGFFFFGVETDPPPYPLTHEQQDTLFAEAFLLKTDEAVADSMPLFAGRERWQIWERQP